MKKFHLLTAVCAVAGAMFVTACASVIPEGEAPEAMFAPIADDAAAAVMEAKEAQDITPGVYVADKLKDILTVKQQPGMSSDEDGMLRIRVTAETSELPFFTWLVFPNRTYKITYRFIWFDENGKVQKAMTPVDCREVMPGNPVRFSAKAKELRSKKFALVLTAGCSGKCEKAEAPAEKK